MSEIAFHFNVPDRLAHACRLLRKVSRLGHRVLVTGPESLLGALDVQLWTFEAQEFVPHCRDRDRPFVQATSPILLSTGVPGGTGRDVLVNLGSDVPDSYAAFERVIEIVSLAEDERLAARERWRRYVRDGHELVRHDLAAPVDPA